MTRTITTTAAKTASDSTGGNLFPKVRLRYHARQMRCGLFASALLLYLSLDFSNPLIPGAVSFISGEIEMVEGAQSRGPETPAAAMAATPRAAAMRPLDCREPQVRAVRAPVRTDAVFAPPRRLLSSQGDSTPSPDDD